MLVVMVDFSCPKGLPLNVDLVVGQAVGDRVNSFQNGFGGPPCSGAKQTIMISSVGPFPWRVGDAAVWLPSGAAK